MLYIATVCIWSGLNGSVVYQSFPKKCSIRIFKPLSELIGGGHIP